MKTTRPVAMDGPGQEEDLKDRGLNHDDGGQGEDNDRRHPIREPQEEKVEGQRDRQSQEKGRGHVRQAPGGDYLDQVETAAAHSGLSGRVTPQPGPDYIQGRRVAGGGETDIVDGHQPARLDGEGNHDFTGRDRQASLGPLARRRQCGHGDGFHLPGRQGHREGRAG